MILANGLHKDELFSRARGAFLGVAVGDALGAPVEFMTASEIKAQHGLLKEMVGGGWLRLKPGQVTDDTDMSLCVARALTSARCWDLTAIADQFAAWLKTRPIDVGDTCRRGIRNYMLKGVTETPFNQWDAGNGAAMRMVAVALFTLGDDQLLERCAMEQARLTHNHPLSDQACICLGRLVHLAIQGHSKNRLRRQVDRLIEAQPSFRFDNYKGMATGYVVDTVQTVFHHFFRTANFEDFVVATVNQGGDADTTGSIAGMLAGAYYGEENIPRRWIRKLPRQTAIEVTELSQKLVVLSPLLQ